MAITFNESYYLQTNPDVALAVSLRQFASGADHFNKLGANELRNPNAVFDSKYYAAQNPDVLTAVSAKTFSSVYAHYLANGLKEGRAPNASLKGFDGADYIAKNPDVAAAGFTAATALQHYVQYGVDENRSFTSSTAGAVTGNVSGTTGDDTITPAGGQASTVRVEGGQQSAAGDTLVITSGSASSFQVIDLSNNGGDQNQTRDNTTGTNTGAKVGPVVQGFENVDARQATINMNLTAIDRTSVGNFDGKASAITGSVIQGGTGRDTLTGNAGADSLVGGVGNDSITGGAGADTLSGGADDDVISGGAGNDTITDEAGNDTVTGDAGNDTITVGAGINSIDGGADNDSITLSADQATSTTVSTISGGAGDDTITLNATAITAASRSSVSGGAGNDTIIAGLGVETVNAGAGNDTVRITSTNLGTTDVFNGNDGQDIIQLEIPTGSGTNTFVFQSLGATAATSQFSGFEAIALIDSSGNTNAKQYKLILTDTFLAQNLVNGSFLIDARGLPGGSNLVIDFSALTAASAALFTAGAFRVLASPSTDVRDQNNVTITNTYLTNTSNTLLSATAAFNIFAGDTTITAGTAQAYNTDRTVNTGSTATTGAQAVYTTQGGTAETAAGGGASGNTVVVTNAVNLVNSTTAVGTSSSSTFLTSNNDSITGFNFVGNTSQIVDASTGDNDTLTILAAATGATTSTPTLTNIETLNVQTAAANDTLNASFITGLNTINVSGTSLYTVTALTQTTRAFGLSGASGADLTVTYAGSDSNTQTATLTLSGGTVATATSSSDFSSTVDVDQLTIVSSGTTANAVTLIEAYNEANGSVAETITVTGTAAATIRGSFANLGTANNSTITASNTGGTTVRYTDAVISGSVSGYNNVAGYAYESTANAVTVTGINGTSSTHTLIGADVTTDTFSATTAGHTLNIVDATATADTYTIAAGNANISTVNLTVSTTADTITLQNFNGAGGQTFNLVGPTATSSAALTVTLANQVSGSLTFNAGTYAGALTVTTTGANPAVNVTTGSGADSITGTINGDVINGGAGNDTIANRATGGNATAADVLTGGAGGDTFILRGDLASGALSTIQDSATRISDFVVGTDVLQLSATVGNYSGGSALFAGVSAASAAAIQSVAQNAAAAAIVTGTDLIKLTTGVATAGLTLQQAFNAAIGTATVTGLTASDDIFVTFYDTTNSRAVVALVDAGSAGTNTIVETADAVTLIGTINMSATDYGNFSASSLSIIAA